MSHSRKGSIQHSSSPPSYSEATPLLDSQAVHSPVSEKNEEEGAEGLEEGSLEQSDQHKNKDFQLISVPEGTVSSSDMDSGSTEIYRPIALVSGP